MPSHRTVLVACVLAACAHARAPVPSPAAAAPSGKVLTDDSLGYSLELPRDIPFRQVTGESIAAVSENGIVVRVFPLFLARSATAPACWERLLQAGVLPPQMVSPPKDATRLGDEAPRGLPIRGGGRLYVSVFPRADRCLVLAVDSVPIGKVSDGAVAEVAELARRTFRTRSPAARFRPSLLLAAGWQLLEAGEDLSALARFEKALKLDPSLERAHLGAGLAAFYAGKGHEKEAVAELTKVLQARRPPAGLGRLWEVREYREALMDLGLAYASLKEYGPAEDRLMEASDRYPHDAVVQYNLACVFALSGQPSDALDELERALTRDPSLVAQAQEDHDLASVRASPRFQKAVAAAKRALPNAPAKGD